MWDRFKKFTTGDNLPRFVILVFLIVLFAIAAYLKQPIGILLSDSLIRYGMNGILVLAMVPAIQAGTGPNFGLPIGIIGGLLGMLISMEIIPNDMFGHQWIGLLVAVLGAIVFGIIFGWLYGLLLNRVKGSEMVIATYTAFSFVALMCIAWLVLPFKNKSMLWPIGKGLKNTITMENTYGGLLNDFLSFKFVEDHATGNLMVLFNKTGQYVTEHYGIESVTKFQIPTGMILFFLLFCYLVYLFVNSRTGVAMRAVGDNPKFAESSGINVNRSRLLGVIISTVLGAIGIIVYSQGFGYMQLYNAPQTMAFQAVAAILIGGASASKAKISHVLVGTFLFNAILVVSLPVANQLVPDGGISDVFRVVTTYGVILFALTKVGGKSNA